MNDNLKQRPIGVFDSGVGGLTVVRALMERLPMENIVYFGDTARVPYGVKSRPTIETFTAHPDSFFGYMKLLPLLYVAGMAAFFLPRPFAVAAILLLAPDSR